MRLLLDEMYPPSLATLLNAAGIDAVTAADLRLTGASDAEAFAAARAAGRAVLTENIADFTRLAAAHAVSGGHHHGLLIALPSRFSRRPAGPKQLVAAVRGIAGQDIDDRVVYLRPVGG